MKIPGVLMVASLISCMLWIIADAEIATNVLPSPAPKDVAIMVRDLMDEDFKVRERASHELWNLGDAALLALQQAAKSDDPEQAIRARDLLRKIQLNITPGTDPDIMEMVEKYAKASAEEKFSLLSKMMARRAWRQMLKLYATETKQDVMDKLQPLMSEIAVRAAREALSNGKDQEARDYLEMAPISPSSLLALAEFHRTHGTLLEEIERAKAHQGDKTNAWLLALYRSAGEITAAREAATAAGETQIAAAMAALSGDPIPWLLSDHRKDDESDENEEIANLPKLYASLAAKRWQGKQLRPGDFASILKHAQSRNSVVAGSGAGILFLLGEPGIVEKAFAKNSALEAFGYFDTLERVSDALSALGLDPDHLDYPSWIKKRVSKMIADDIEDQHGVSTHLEELLTLAGLFERRGLLDEGKTAFAESLATLEKKDEKKFIDFIGSMFGERNNQGNAPKLARRIGVEWAGEDENRWKDLVAAAFGDDEESSAWWAWLVEISPESQIAERFDAMLALFNRCGDPSNLREKWLSLAWKHIEQTPVAQRTKALELISSLSLGTGDVVSSLKAWDQLPESSREEIFWGGIVFHLSSAGRWAECATLMLKQIKDLDETKEEHSALLHAYAAVALRKAGRAQEAELHDQWAEKLSLGDVSMLIQIGQAYAFGMDFSRATDWWARAARMANPKSREIAVAFKHYSDALLVSRRWDVAAATTEVLCMIICPQGGEFDSPLPLMRQRGQADLARAMSILKSDRATALKSLEKCYQMLARDGSLADYFFPAIREAGLIEQHDKWFLSSWTQLSEVIRKYPGSDNTRNTAAWLASRSMRKLDEAEIMLAKALQEKPDQSAYLDTMAEINFAKGNREKAIEWSKLAINYLPQDMELRRQNLRFLSDPLPK